MIRGLVVHFNDLRVADHRPLRVADATHRHVFGLVCIDPVRWDNGPYGFPRMGPHRLHWYLECVEALRLEYRKLGGELIVRVGSTAEVVAKVAADLRISAIYGQRGKTAEEVSLLQAIEDATPHLDHEWLWNDVLFEPEEWTFHRGDFPQSYSAFRRMAEKRWSIGRTTSPPKTLSAPDIDPGETPRLSDLGFEVPERDERSPIFGLKPGRSGAVSQLQRWFSLSAYPLTYRDTRNGMLLDTDSSKLSVYLGTGCVSPREVFEALRAFEVQFGANDSTDWFWRELLWREYFHALAHHYGTRLFQQSGIQNRTLVWRLGDEGFERWLLGLTGNPFVDASMRELLQTGYLSNRGRQVVASYLARELQIDWRLGAYWFEHHLIDYDPCVNWGNWQYIAGVGTDPRDRRFNVRRQATLYDPDARYVYRWCNELRQLQPGEVIAMNRDLSTA